MTLASQADVNAACEAFWAKRGEKPMTWAMSRERAIRLAYVRRKAARRSAIERAAAEIERGTE